MQGLKLSELKPDPVASQRLDAAALELLRAKYGYAVRAKPFSDR